MYTHDNSIEFNKTIIYFKNVRFLQKKGIPTNKPIKTQNTLCILHKTSQSYNKWKF